MMRHSPGCGPPSRAVLFAAIHRQATEPSHASGPTGRLTVMSSCLVVSVGPILVCGSLGGGLRLDYSGFRREQGIKADCEQDGSQGISGLHLPPTPVRDLRD